MQKRVGILRGGIGKNYRHSLRQGGEIIYYLSENLGRKYRPLDILIDQEGIWHLSGKPIQLADLMHRVDIVWNIAHANHSHSLDSLSVPHLSPAPYFSALKGSKKLLQEHLKTAGVNLPRSIILPVYQADFDGPADRYALKKAIEIHEKFGAPWTVKSFSEDKNMAIHLAKTFPELVAAIEDGVRHKQSVLVEEFIYGKIASLHSVPNFRGQEIYTFPLSRALGAFSDTEKEKLHALAKHLHRHFGAGCYLRSDFLLTPRQKIYLLEFDNVPDLKPGSHFSQACELAGTQVPEVVEHLLESAENL